MAEGTGGPKRQDCTGREAGTEGPRSQKKGFKYTRQENQHVCQMNPGSVPAPCPSPWVSPPTPCGLQGQLGFPLPPLHWAGAQTTPEK